MGKASEKSNITGKSKGHSIQKTKAFKDIQKQVLKATRQLRGDRSKQQGNSEAKKRDNKSVQRHVNRAIGEEERGEFKRGFQSISS